MMLRTVAALLCLCPLLFAQVDKPAEGNRPGEEARGIDRKMRALRDRAAKSAGLTEAEMENLSKEEIDKLVSREEHREPVLTSSSMCRFVATIKPSKLMPGQSGTMRVTAILSGSAVIPDPAPIERAAPGGQGFVQMGALSFRPAEIGRGLAPAYVGRPVYDNTAVFELPISIAPEAEIGKKQPVSLDLRFELFDGTTGQSIGKFIDRAVAEVEVGQVADPAVRMPAGAAPTAVAERPAEPAATRVQPESAPAAKAPVKMVEAKPAQVVPDAASNPPPSPESSTAAEPPLDGGEGAPILPIAIGGGLLLLVVVMLVARKK